MKNLLSAALASLLFLCQCAVADEFEPGPYIAGGPTAVGIEASYCSFGPFVCNDFSHSPNSGATSRILLGYNIENNFGIEAGVTSLGQFDVRNPAGALVGNFKATATTLGFKTGHLRSRGFSTFAEFGLASVKTQYNTTASWTLNGTRNQRTTGYYAGVGVEYDLNKIFGFRTSFNLLHFADAEFSSVMSTVSVMAVAKF